MKKERLFTNRQLLTLLWPLIIEQMLEILVGMAAVSYTHLTLPTT